MMVVNVEDDIVRVVILDIGGLYTQIYDELYCSKERYDEILAKSYETEKYKVALI